MAKRDSKYKISHLELQKKLNNDTIPNNILLFTHEKILLDEVTSLIANNFLGETVSKENVHTFYADDKNIEGVINECSNISMFSERKIVILKVLKRAGTKGGFTNAERQSMINYINNFSPDIILIIAVIDREFNFEHYEDFLTKTLSAFIIDSDSEDDFRKWIKLKLKDYKINDDSILHLIQFLNPSYDEINTEIEKLKTFCIDKKEITKDDINFCIGFTKDFDENDFLEAVLTRNYGKAIQVYNKMNLKEDIEIYLVVLLSSSMISVSKLMDPGAEKMGKWELIKELKLWGDYERKLRILKEFKSKINELKLKQAFDYIYNADKAMKSTGLDNKPFMTDLIYNLTKL